MTASVANIIDKYQGIASDRILRAVQQASVKTGTDFNFLLEKAQTESNFNPTAKAKTSSATGLYQFIENTWLTMVKKYGDKYGLGDMADKITINDSGKACVADCNAKKQILDLRKNPEVSALMAGEFSAENKEYLESKTSGDVGSTEMYMAHFMGAGGAAKFLNAREKNGQANAAALFPDAARANKNVFYDKSGKARSLNDVYAMFDRKFSDNGGASSPLKTAAVSSPDFAATCPADTPAPAYAAQMDPSAVFSPETVIGDMLAQAPSSKTAAKIAQADDGITWFDAPKTQSGRAASRAVAKNQSSHSRIASATGSQVLSPVSMLTVLEMQNTASFMQPRRGFTYNS